jgi:hypothetical protein
VNLTFVVGTGRCGSTMLSHILHLHPDLLSISEFFGVLRAAEHLGPSEFPTRDMDGPELWNLLARPDPLLDAQISAGLTPPEMCYPYGSGRFAPATGVPLICHNLLPGITDEPDSLFDALAATVPTWPRRPAVEQYRTLFDYLATRLGRRAVVERSGASLQLITPLHRHFPEARFIYLHRDGPDCALSMSRHPTFRRQILTAAAAYAIGVPLSCPPRDIKSALPEQLSGLIYPPFDASAIMTHPIPLSLFGSKIWSPMVCAGATALSKLSADIWLRLNYEDVLENPASQLTKLAEFIGVNVTPDWLEAADRLVEPGRARAGKAQFDPGALASLQAACESGAQAMAALSS